MNFKKITLPKNYNYVACFLTFDCNINCRYCINLLSCNQRKARKVISGREWVNVLNRIVPVKDIPITLQGGEPSLHPDFIWIINHINTGHHIDILTNLSFNIDEFIKSVNPRRLKRESLYPSMRVTYHPFYTKLDTLIRKVLKMQEANFSIGIYGILHPKFKRQIMEARRKCRKLGIDFRTKEFLGKFKGKVFGTYRYPYAVMRQNSRSCLCRTTELIIAPDGNVFRCHHDLYKGLRPNGNMLDIDFKIKDDYSRCEHCGSCNPCDIKLKTNRFQEYGHTSVEIVELRK